MLAQIKHFSLTYLANEDLLFLLAISVIISGIIYLLKYFKILKNSAFIVALTLIYALFTFYGLGSDNTPDTVFVNEKNEEVILEITDNDLSFDELYFYAIEADGNNELKYRLHAGKIQVLGSNDNKNYQEIYLLEDDDKYMKWIKVSCAGNYRYLKLIFNSDNSVLNEFGVYSLKTNAFKKLKLISNNPEANNIIDEQDKLIADFDYRHETYFDEIYHARNAYEIANNLNLYTAVHPLIGTRFIALGISIFGMTPFGYRFFGALTSVLLVPLFYLLAKNLFNNNKYANIASLLFSLDFMHYTTGRIATLEPYSILFILLMYLFMLKFAQNSIFDATYRKAYFYLALSALSMAFAWATKWTCIYASVGLAIYFFYIIYKKFNTSGNLKTNRLKLLKCFIFCLFFFVLIPVMVYFLSYLNIRIYPNKPNNIKEYMQQVIDYITYDYTYHRDLVSTHPYSSKWYMWIFNIRPIWYYVKNYENGAIRTISCFNNPAINLFGVLALIYSLYNLIKNKKEIVIMPILAYFSCLCPWLFVQRTTYAYHYYPCIPFLILLIVFFFYDHRNNKKINKIIKIYIAICLIIFIAFLPVIGGFKSPGIYATEVLRWLPSWYFGSSS